MAGGGLTYFCAEPERRDKSITLLSAIAAQWPFGPAVVIEGPPPDDGNPFVAWGQLWTALEIIPEALRTGRPFWHADNGYLRAIGRRSDRCYRLTYRGMSPVLLTNPEPARAASIDMRPWRSVSEHVVIAMPSVHYGRAIGLDMPTWRDRIEQRCRVMTNRRVVVREKPSPAHIFDGRSARSLAHDLRRAHALVTHSSNVAVDAILAGVPVICEPTCPAAPVGNVGLENLHAPATPDRTAWLASLMCQQFTLAEFHSGVAGPWLEAVREQVDRGRPAP